MKSLNKWKTPTSLTTNRYRNPFLSLQQEINNAMDSFYNLFDSPFSYSSELEKLTINPSIDIVEDEKNFKIEIEMPGVGEEDIKVMINNNILSIQAKKKISKKDSGINYISREIGYGTYEKNISLPDYIDADKATASFKKGMLWVSFPKKSDKMGSHKELKIEKG